MSQMVGGVVCRRETLLFAGLFVMCVVVLFVSGGTVVEAQGDEMTRCVGGGE